MGYLAEKTQIGVKNDDDPHCAFRWIPVAEPVLCEQKAWEIRAHGPAYNEIHWATSVSGFTDSYAARSEIAPTWVLASMAVPRYPTLMSHSFPGK